MNKRLFQWTRFTVCLVMLSVTCVSAGHAMARIQYIVFRKFEIFEHDKLTYIFILNSI